MFLKYRVKDKKYQNINQILKQEFDISARLLHKLIINEHVLLNNVRTDTRSLVNIGDIITVNLNFEEESENIVSKNMKLNIVYEDDVLLIINKPIGTAVHPSVLHYEDSLSNGVKFYFESIGLKRKVRPVNRLDFNTSGLIIFAKNEYVQECLIKQMNTHIFQKKYIAIVSGNFKTKVGRINLPIARKENSIIERCVSDSGQEAITDYEVLKEFKIDSSCVSVVKCSLRTGRTHQIRVHMAEIGHPLLGDSMYGTASNLISRQALHSYEISFIHPISLKKLEFICDLPEDMKKICTL